MRKRNSKNITRGVKRRVNLFLNFDKLWRGTVDYRPIDFPVVFRSSYLIQLISVFQRETVNRIYLPHVCKQFD